MRHTIPVLALAALLVGSAGPAGAQSSTWVTGAEIDRLQDAIDDASADLAPLRSSDAARARSLQDTLDDLRDEVTYLKVKARKEGVTRTEYDDLRDRIEDVRRRASGESGSRPVGTVSSSPAGRGDIEAGERGVEGIVLPVGQELDVRLQTRLSSGTAQIEDRFEATTLVDLYQGESLIVPAGSVLRGVVSSVDKAGRMDRKGSLTLAFDQMTVRGVSYPVRATVTQAIESEGVKSEGVRLGIGAAAGAILGGILGGAQGAVAGIFIGSGGVLAAVPGKDVELDSGTVLRIRFDSPVELR